MQLAFMYAHARTQANLRVQIFLHLGSENSCTVCIVYMVQGIFQGNPISKWYPLLSLLVSAMPDMSANPIYETHCFTEEGWQLAVAQVEGDILHAHSETERKRERWRDSQLVVCATATEK